MNVEGLYKVPGVKSKIQYLKKLYNHREPVNMSEFEPTVATSLLILFLRFVSENSLLSPCVLRSNEKLWCTLWWCRELPEPVLENSETISRFEQAASTKDVAQREAQLAQLTQQLPECNRTLLAWVILHLDHVTVRVRSKQSARSIKCLPNKAENKFMQYVIIFITSK